MTLPPARKFANPIPGGSDRMIFKKLGERRKGDEIERIF
jgi:hypothetical protein